MTRGTLITELFSSGMISEGTRSVLEADPTSTLVASSGAPGAAVASVITADADAAYGQPEADLINEIKDQFNALLVQLRAKGIIAT